MTQLRDAWLDCDAWTGGFSWALAHQVCRARSEYPPEAMIDDDWVSEWRSLDFHRHRWFSHFVKLRLEAPEARRLNDALYAHARHENPDPEVPMGRRLPRL